MNNILKSLSIVAIYIVIINTLRFMVIVSTIGLDFFRQNYDWRVWLSELASIVGVLIVGYFHGIIKAPSYLLLIGLVLVPCATYLIVMLHMDVYEMPDYTLWLFPLSNTIAAFLPTLLYWVVKRIQG